MTAQLRFGLLLCILLAIPHATAEIYKYVDETGRITYTNVPRKGAQKLDISAGDPATKARSNTGPSNFPRVDTSTQKRRDDTRRKILEEELSNEQKALAEARQALKDGEAVRLGDEARNYQKYLDRVDKLKKAVASLERSVEALRKELSDTR